MNDGNILYLLRNLAKRHRVSVTDGDGREVWYTFTTVLKVALWGLLAAVVLFVASLLVAAHTKVLDIIPGYDGITSRERMVENIIRLDSLERELNYRKAYTENVAQIMEGRSPVVRSLAPTEEEKITSNKEVVVPSSLDSLLRAQMEGSERYGLNTKPERSRLSNEEILRPVAATVLQRFSPSAGVYGVRLQVADIQQVCAVQSGTVILSVFEPEGYTIQIQHSAGFISTYRGLGQSHKEVGARVAGGEAIGATWHEENSVGESTEMELQFWFDGKAVDPEQYIQF